MPFKPGVTSHVELEGVQSGQHHKWPLEAADVGAATPADVAAAEQAAEQAAQDYTDQAVGAVTPESIGAATPADVAGAQQAAQDYTDQALASVTPESIGAATPADVAAAEQAARDYADQAVERAVEDVDPEAIGSIPAPSFIPSIKKTVMPITNPAGISVDGNYAYVTTAEYNGGFHGLAVVDVSDPLTPALIGQIEDDVNLRGAKHPRLRGSFCLVAASTNPTSIAAVNIADPLAPILAGSLANVDGSQGMALAGNVLLAQAYSGVLSCVDISNPAAPALLGSVSDGDMQGYSVMAYGDGYVFVAMRNTNIIVVIDVTDPTQPVVVDRYANSAVLLAPQSIAYLNRRLYVTNFANLYSLLVLDASNPEALHVLGEVRNAALHSPGGGLLVRSGAAYVLTNIANADGRLVSVDVSDPAAPQLIRSVQTPDLKSGAGLAFRGNYIVTISGTGVNKLCVWG